MAFATAVSHLRTCPLLSSSFKLLLVRLHVSVHDVGSAHEECTCKGRALIDPTSKPSPASGGYGSSALFLRDGAHSRHPSERPCRLACPGPPVTVSCAWRLPRRNYLRAMLYPSGAREFHWGSARVWLFCGVLLTSRRLSFWRLRRADKLIKAQLRPGRQGTSHTSLERPAFHGAREFLHGQEVALKVAAGRRQAHRGASSQPAPLERRRSEVGLNFTPILAHCICQPLVGGVAVVAVRHCVI